MRNTTRLKKLAFQGMSRREILKEKILSLPIHQYLMEKIVCRIRGHKWREKMRDKFCERCGEADYTFYRRGTWER